mgnify:CR=1 FL=1
MPRTYTKSESGEASRKTKLEASRKRREETGMFKNGKAIKGRKVKTENTETPTVENKL